MSRLEPPTSPSSLEERGQLPEPQQRGGEEAEASARAPDDPLLAAESGGEHYPYLAEALPQPAWAARPDGWVVYHNQRWSDYTGLTREQSLGYGWTGALHPEDRQPCLDRWEDATRAGEGYESELRLRAADGTYRWFLVRSLPVRDRDGRVVSGSGRAPTSTTRSVERRCGGPTTSWKGGFRSEPPN